MVEGIGTHFSTDTNYYVDSQAPLYAKDGHTAKMSNYVHTSQVLTTGYQPKQLSKYGYAPDALKLMTVSCRVSPQRMAPTC